MVLKRQATNITDFNYQGKETMEKEPTISEPLEPEVREMIEDAEKEVALMKKEIIRLETIITNFKKMHNNWATYKNQLGLGDET